jgi:hypothetical protein
MYSKQDLDSRFVGVRRALLKSGEFKLDKFGKIAVGGEYGINYDSPWVYIEPARHKFCFLWNHVYRGKFRHIPTHCRYMCWKVVIKPRTLKELIGLYNALRHLELPSKCGIDERDYTYGPWAGYVYADSLPEGQKYARQIRKVVSKTLSSDVPVTLKRGCTEMEDLKPSDTWDEMTDKEIKMERLLEDLFRLKEDEVRQSRWLVEDTKYRWLRHAIKIGDPTAKEVAEELSGDPDAWSKLVVQSVSYPYEDESNG